MKRKKDQMALHLMMLPGMILLAIFSFTPMFGIIMAFQNYLPARGIAKSPWVGMDNFIFMFQMPDSKQIFINTITIAVGKIILSTFVTIVFALLLLLGGVYLLAVRGVDLLAVHEEKHPDHRVSAQLPFLGHSGDGCGQYLFLRGADQCSP